MSKPIRELVIDIARHDPAFRIIPTGRSVVLHEYRMGYGLKAITGVTSMNVHFVPDDITTADLSFDDGRRETWLVIGIRLQCQVGLRKVHAGNQD